MPQLKFLGVERTAKAKPVRDTRPLEVKKKDTERSRVAKAKLKSLATLEGRIKQNPPTAGNGLENDRGPKDLEHDHGEISNLFRFELADRSPTYYTLVGEPGGVRASIIYLTT